MLLVSEMVFPMLFAMSFVFPYVERVSAMAFVAGPPMATLRYAVKGPSVFAAKKHIAFALPVKRLHSSRDFRTGIIASKDSDFRTGIIASRDLDFRTISSWIISSTRDSDWLRTEVTIFAELLEIYDYTLLERNLELPSSSNI